MHEVSAAVP